MPVPRVAFQRVGGRVATRSMLSALFAVMALFLGSVAPVSAASGIQQERGYWRVMQFNFCGNNDTHPACGVEGSTGAAVDDLVDKIVAFKPMTVSLNEMCRNQFDALKDRLGHWPMSGRWTTTSRRSDLHCTDHKLGIGILTRPPMGKATVTCLSNCDTPVSESDHEALLCANMHFQVLTRFCAVHIGTTDRAERIATVVSTVNEYEQTTPVIVGGDFDVKPTNDALDAMYSSGGGGAAGLFQEADHCSSRSKQTRKCNEGTHAERGPDRKIDYMFVSARDFLNLSADATSAKYSSHDPLLAYLGQCNHRHC